MNRRGERLCVGFPWHAGAVTVDPEVQRTRELLVALLVPLGVLVGPAVAWILSDLVPRTLIVPIQAALIGSLAAMIGARLPRAVRLGASPRQGALLGAGVGVASVLAADAILVWLF